MFDDYESQYNPDRTSNNFEEYLKSQNSDQVILLWSQNPETREQIARNLYLLSDPKAADSLFQFLSQRHEEASEDEKDNIVQAMDTLGSRHLPTEINATNFLVNNFSAENDRAIPIIRALKGKVMGATLPDYTSADIERHLPIIESAGGLFLDILEGDYPHELKIQAMVGISRCEHGHNLRSRLYANLEQYAQSDDDEASLHALGNLVGLERKNPTLVSQGLTRKFESGWVDEATDEEISQLITITGLNNDPNLRPYLLDLKIHPRCINNDRQQKNIEWALKKLVEKEQGEK